MAEQTSQKDQNDSVVYLSTTIESVMHDVMKVVPDKSLNVIITSLMSLLAKGVSKVPEDRREAAIMEVVTDFPSFVQMACEADTKSKESLKQNTPTTATSQ